MTAWGNIDLARVGDATRCSRLYPEAMGEALVCLTVLRAQLELRRSLREHSGSKQRTVFWRAEGAPEFHRLCTFDAAGC